MARIDTDHINEVLQVLSQNKLRTFLTACGVFWGVFMLICMLGVGNGLQAGVSKSMGGFATNAMWIWGSVRVLFERQPCSDDVFDHSTTTFWSVPVAG